MIKKIILGLGLSVISFIGFTNAKVQEVGLLKYPSAVNQNYSIGFIKGGGIITDFVGVNKAVAGFDLSRLLWWSTNGLPYVYLKSNNSYVPTVQGFFDRYYICDQLTTIDTLPDNCTVGGYFDYSGSLENDMVFLKSFFSNVVSEDLVYYGNIDSRYVGATLDYRMNGIDICWSSSSLGKSLCFRANDCVSSNSSYCNSYRPGYFVNSQNLSDLTFGNVSDNWIGKAPGQFGYGNNNFNPGEVENITGNIEEVPTDIDSYIAYYETRYNWNEGLCYVGTNDLTGAYGKPGVEFEYGSGGTMFDLYYTMYGTFGSNIISNVGSFINTWMINYNQWFYTLDDERLYLARYNGPDTNITLYYDNLEFPFRNNRVAIYFLVSNLYDYMPEQSMGEHFAFYCSSKLNYDNYKNGSLNFQDLLDKVDLKIQERIKEYNNNYLPSQYGFSVPNMSGNDNIWGNLIQTGSGIPEDLNPSGLFKQFYDRINNLLQNFSPSVAIGFIPLWILYPMLFLILFRIFRH